MKSSKSSLSKEDEARYSSIVLPSWLAAFSTGGNTWKTPDDKDCNSLLNFCEHVFGGEFAHKLDFKDGSELWKKVSTVRGHFRVPTSLTEYLRPKAVNTFHLSDTPYIPPHRRRLYNPYLNSSPSQPPSVS